MPSGKCPFAKAQKDAGAHATSIGDALAGPNLISPDMYRQFALEPEKKMTEEVQAYGIPLSLHICGNTNAIIEDMGTTGARILEVDWKLDMEEARRLVPMDTILMGNVDPSFPLVHGTPAEVDAAVKNWWKQPVAEAISSVRVVPWGGILLRRISRPLLLLPVNTVLMRRLCVYRINRGRDDRNILSR